MPRDIIENLLASIDAGATSLTELILITPKVGDVLAFTRHVKDLVIDSQRYIARPGMYLTRTSSNISLAVDNSEGAGGFQPGIVTAEDLWNRRFESARFTRSFCDYEHPDYGAHVFQRGFLGRVDVADNAFKAELRSLTQLLQQPVGEVLSATCRVARVGDSECKLNVGAGSHPTVSLPYRSGSQTVDAVAGLLRFTATMTQAWPTNFFDNGLLTWLTGRNAPYQMEVKSYTQSGGLGTFVLQEPMGYSLLPGDTFSVDWGCDRTFDRCLEVGNVINRRAEDYLVGEQTLRSVAG